jgi:predicted metalloprotease
MPMRIPMGRMPGGGKAGGGIGIIVVIIVVVLLLGGDPLSLLQGGGGASPGAAPPASGRMGAPSDEAGEFVSTMLASTEDVWDTIFAQSGARYQRPNLVLYDDVVRSACGMNSAATGPFYCPLDAKVYIDLGFFRELARMGGAGDFAQAYVIGHEIGHHVQNITGRSDRVRSAQRGAGKRQANELSVLQELQADCYAGVWAHHANRQKPGDPLLETGDVEEGMNAARAIGDDRLQRQAGRAVHPESFTHGTSEQRARWLRIGLETGNVEACDTFARAG